MGHQDAKMREYERMTRDGLRPMTSREKVEEAIDTIKIGRRKAISGKATLDSFFTGGCKDQSLSREGLLDLQNGIEMMLKGLIEYYGESYKEEHYTNVNGQILEDLTRQNPDLHDLHDAFGILQDDDFSFMMYKCSKYPRYQSYKSSRDFRSLAYKLVDLLVGYADTYILCKRSLLHFGIFITLIYILGLIL